MTQELTSLAGSDNNHRILVAASDAESVSLDSLEAESAIIRESMGEYWNSNSEIRIISTLDQDVFVAELKNFQPNIVHFSNRGSAQPCIRMFSGGKWIRQITGKTIVRLFSKARCYVESIILVNCSVYRDEAYMLAKSDYVLSITNRYPTFGISPNVIRELYSDLSRGEGYGSAINRFLDFASRQTPSNHLEFKVRGKEVPEGLSDTGRSSFLLWTMGKAFTDSSLGGDRVSADSASDANRAEQLQVEQVDQAKRLAGADEEVSRVVTESGRRLYRVWFGTNRKPIGAVGSGEFGGDRDEIIHYGYCDVVIPKHHKIGQVSDPWLKRWLWSGESNSLKIEASTSLDAEEFFCALRQIYEGLPNDEDSLLVFLHGYNVEFNHAAIRAAQLGVDLGVKGTTAFFSWPSKGKFLGYMADEAAIEASEEAIGEFLIELTKQSGAKRIHLIAHSMGNRGLLKALNSMLDRVQNKVGRRVDQIFLAAPDVDAQVFRNLAKVYKQASNRTTMYVSAKDLALLGSGFFHAFERAGYTPPVTVVPNIDTVEVSNLNLDLLGHGYVSDAKEVLTDMYTLMTSNTDPDKRFGLQTRQTAKGDKYWLVKA